MKAPLIWLKDFTDIDVSAKELADKMTLTGSKVEEVIDYDIKNATLQENIKNICDRIDELIDEDELKREELINEAISDLGDFSGDTINE